MNDKIVGYQTMVLIHWSQTAANPALSPNAWRTQWNTPPSSGWRDENSAETSETGIKKTTAESMKKKTSELPNRAIAGRLRMLSIAATMSITSEKRGIFLCILQ